MRVFIVDDSAMLRDRLVTMLSEVSEVQLIGQAADPTEAMAAIGTLKPDAVVLDIQMPGGSGITVLQHIKKKNDPAPVVMMLTNFPYRQYRKRCLEAGADYFLDKSTEFDRVREILQGLVQESR